MSSPQDQPQSFPSKVTLIGNYPPRRCGIATFTSDLRQALVAARPQCAIPVVTMTDRPESYEYPDEVRLEIMEDHLDDYSQAGEFIDLHGGQAISIQHEFGIFGGPAGEHLITLLDETEVPIVTTLHTVLSEPNPDQRRVFERLADRSSRLVVMSEKGKQILEEVWEIPAGKIAVIPHGIPDVPFTDPAFFREKFDLQAKKVILTFGLIGQGKGIEDGIRAMPEVISRHPDAIYVILGATHPNLIRHEGEKYREGLIQLTRELGVQDHVRFVNQYLEFEDLLEWIGAADLYLTPYPNEAQITSGTLAYSYGAGKAVVSTPYWHAQELLEDGSGKLVRFNDPASITRAINELLDDPGQCAAIRRAAYQKGRQMVWSEVARRYHDVFAQVATESLSVASSSVTSRSQPLAAASPAPNWKMDHVLRLSDSTGMFQHARLHLPWFEHGYCSDDNARALILTAELESLDALSEPLKLQQAAYASFLEHAFDQQSRRFRNFLSFDRRWMEEVGSEDSHARALWALGLTVQKTRQASLRSWAADIFEQAFEVVESFTSPRAWAFSILGLRSWLQEFPADRLAQRLTRSLATKLLEIYQQTADSDWNWFEERVTYDNARLPQALLLAGDVLGEDQFLHVGLSSLRWLQEHQTGHDGCFRPIGSNGFWKKGQLPAWYDQQPLEATAAAAACHTALQCGAPDEEFWKAEVLRAHQWFMGRNDLKIPLYDASTGGCFDGLQANRVNRNQGAESTLSFWLSLAEIRTLAASLPHSESSASFGVA